MVETVVVPPAPVAAPSLGQTVDADLVALKARITALEGNASAFWTKQVTWLKTNWPHLVTIGLAGLTAVKTDALSILVKLF
ncbi:MAG: hypothetical protein ACLQNV_15235 [Steroidobacteraceae bacterium]|jgi:hypothetical protein